MRTHRVHSNPSSYEHTCTPSKYTCTLLHEQKEGQRIWGKKMERQEENKNSIKCIQTNSTKCKSKLFVKYKKKLRSKPHSENDTQ